MSQFKIGLSLVSALIRRNWIKALTAVIALCLLLFDKFVNLEDARAVGLRVGVAVTMMLNRIVPQWNAIEGRVQAISREFFAGVHVGLDSDDPR